MVEPYDTGKRIDFRDFNIAEVAAETPYSREELVREMHVLTPDGRWHAGFFGWVAVLRELPRRRWLAKVLSMPPFRWIGPVLYRLIAANRFRIPKVLLRGVGVPSPCGENCSLPNVSTKEHPSPRNGV